MDNARRKGGQRGQTGAYNTEQETQQEDRSDSFGRVERKPVGGEPKGSSKHRGSDSRTMLPLFMSHMSGMVRSASRFHRPQAHRQVRLHAVARLVLRPTDAAAWSIGQGNVSELNRVRTCCACRARGKACAVAT